MKLIFIPIVLLIAGCITPSKLIREYNSDCKIQRYSWLFAYSKFDARNRISKNLNSKNEYYIFPKNPLYKTEIEVFTKQQNIEWKKEEEMKRLNGEFIMGEPLLVGPRGAELYYYYKLMCDEK